MSKKLLALLALGTLFAGVASTGPAYAATTQYDPTQILLNGVDATNPAHITAIDTSTGQPTSFVPIYYLETVLSQLGIASTWDGTTWNLTPAAGMNPNTASPSTAQNQMDMAINGLTVQTAPKVVAVDPAGGSETSYIPLYYASQILTRLGVQSNWTGTQLQLTYAVPTSQLATKLQAAQAFISATTNHYRVIPGGSNGFAPGLVEVLPDPSTTNPYQDVPTAAWGDVHEAVEAKFFAPDSSSNFGVNDPVTAQMLDNAAQYFWGIPSNQINGNVGGNTVAWANVYELNNGIPTTGPLTTAELTQFIQNLNNVFNGYTVANGVYHLIPLPGNVYYKTVLAQMKQFPLPPAWIASNWAIDAENMEKISFTYNNGTFLFRVPGMSDKAVHNVTVGTQVVGVGGNQQYSLNNGQTWNDNSETAMNGYGSGPSYQIAGEWFTVGGTANPPATVLVKGHGVATINEGENGPYGEPEFGAGLEYLMFGPHGTLHVEYPETIIEEPKADLYIFPGQSKAQWLDYNY